MKPSAPTQSSANKIAYFQPGEMVYLISHENDQLIDAPIDKLIEWSNDKDQVGDLKLSVSRRQGRELHFPGTRELARVQKQQRTPRPGIQYKSPEPELRGAFSLMTANVRDNDNPAGYVDDSKLAELIVRLDDARERQPLHQQGITLQMVSPNWLSSAGSEADGTGGPGSRPEPYTGATDAAPYQFALPPAIVSLCPEEKERGKGVKVAILDTAPCLHDLAEAYERYQKVNPQNIKNRHPLIESLLRLNGPLHVHPASYEELLRMRSVHLKDHNYKMTDHGLFVAGIIHTIAPAAELHLIEVLNPDGVGDMVSIAKGLQRLLNEEYFKWKNSLLVVNCSLVLNIPLLNHPITNLDEALMDRIAPQRHQYQSHPDRLDPKLLGPINTAWLARQVQAIERICDLLFWQGSRVIAAAGNDWRPEEHKDQPQARYPAAFNSALGVGALPKQEASKGTVHIQTGNPIASSYSNLADRPGSVGITTLGGEPGEEHGILGVYVGEFPPLSFFQRLLKFLITILGGTYAGPKNDSDWAWWAGTSFATPILTGLIAAVLSGPDRFSTVEQAIVKMYMERVILEEQPLLLEDRLIEVTQG